LFVAAGGAYFGLPDVEPWDEARDARQYADPWPVVAHPPCARWCQLAPLNAKRYGLELGDDDGCFESALSSVRHYGGVLEHPAFSYAWAAFDLPRPPRAGWQAVGLAAWVGQVPQAAYGHRARKLSWLYYVGRSAPPVLNWSRPAHTAKVSFLANNGGADLPVLRGKAASATPPAFRDALLAIARGAPHAA